MENILDNIAYYTLSFHEKVIFKSNLKNTLE